MFSNSIDMSFGKIGIVNSGNNCYLNSALQFISQAVWVNKDLLDEEDENDLQNIYIKFVLDKWSSGNLTNYNPKNIKLIIAKQRKQFSNNDQQDSHELLVCFLDIIENKIIKNYFDSTLQSITKCFKCGYMYRTKNVLRFIPLTLTDTNCTLDECFTQFITQEYLDNYWKCEKCKNNKGQKTLTIKKWAPYIIIHLKRFKWEENGKRINYRVEFPIYWHRKEMKNNKYKLRSIINHYGTFNNGHYTSCGRIHSDQWIDYNDKKNKPIKSQIIQNRYNISAYLLLYEKDDY